jgi:uncharacterized phiE125 gp8 family phage protein
VAASSLVTAPASEPISLLDARAQCRVTANNEDALLAMLIRSAREWGQGYTRRAIMAQTWDYYLDCFPCEITLPMAPVTEVTSIQYYDSDNALQSLTSSAYDVDLMSTTARIVPALGYSWPVAYSRLNAVVVRYVAGYSRTDPDMDRIRPALLLHVQAHYDRDADYADLMSAAERHLDPIRRL